ncbi:MAG: hypothetical protein NTY19_16065 [Planctomycetota bacterium]|nr:hypothetical protein [Planctomycetota bacterium]
MPCFPRHLSDDFLRLLVPGGPLNFLIAGCPQSAVPDHYAVDVQLRAGNTIQYYHGTTSLLRITFDGIQLQADAAGKYRGLPGFTELFTSRSLESAALKEYQRLLPMVLDHIAGDLERLVRQKALLGLLPSEAVNRLPATGIRRVDCAVVVVAKDGERTSSDRLRDRMTFQGETGMPIFQLWSDDRTALSFQRLREGSC